MTVSKKVRKHLRSIAKLGGQATSRVMSDEDKVARARAGGEKVAEKMTPESRTERARNAALVRHAKKRVEATL